jgi:hypothetical protein
MLLLIKLTQYILFGKDLTIQQLRYSEHKIVEKGRDLRKISTAWDEVYA